MLFLSTPSWRALIRVFRKSLYRDLRKIPVGIFDWAHSTPFGNGLIVWRFG